MQMVLIADSGNSRCKWAVVDTEGTVLKEFKSDGINPYFHSTEKIKATLWEVDDALLVKGKINHLFFYGAGCSSENLQEIVKTALASFFSEAEVYVNHDLVSSSYATYSGKPVISCILGTGSNSAYFDGNKVSDVIPNLAYVLGDEGSGCYFGKILLRDFFYGVLPEEIRKEFNAEFRLSVKEVNEKVYRSSNPNVFLASFMPFLKRHTHTDYVKKLMTEGFQSFLRFQVMCFPNWADVEVSFLGSIAIHFEELLAEACFLEGVTLGRVVSDPMGALIDYHVKYVIPEKVLS